MKCVGYEGSLMRVRFGEDGDVVYLFLDDRMVCVWDVFENVMDLNMCVFVCLSVVLVGYVVCVWDCVCIDGERFVYVTAGGGCMGWVWGVNNVCGMEIFE